MNLVLSFSLLASVVGPVDFVRDVRPLLERHCQECHGEKKQKSGLRLDVKSEALRGGDNHGPDIVPGRPGESPLIRFLRSDDPDEAMPPGEKLAAAEIDLLTRWVAEGAPWPDGVDTARIADKRDHWSFKPVQAPAVGGVDRLIDAKLAEKGLRRSRPAEPANWLRRVTLDLTGLPPSPEEMEAFLRERDPAAVVDRLLASPRYGERWAQHWLDVVRYADTHGFEVNTERPNAWPYRDYVIRAFNDDVPYDRFIREQIAGDATGQDAATGFLVTASVLLPGQIGKDEPSKRLARQDSIDEIVVNIGQTFLGLGIGCARCHDHKFDPIRARDYYAMQAFVAGVEYGERDLRSPEADAARARFQEIKAGISGIDQALSRFVPLAGSGARRSMVNARENRDRFAPVRAKRVRFTIRATNQLEPCVDELEVFATSGVNLARDARVTVSGERFSAGRHEQRFLNDGLYGNSSSWMSSETGKGWVMVEFAEEREIDLVVWGRDRQGRLNDRLATEYVIEAGDAAGVWKVVADATDRQAFDPAAREASAFSLTGLSPEEADAARRLLERKRPLETELAGLEAGQRVFAGTFRTPDVIHLLNRGDPEQPGEPVVPAVPEALGTLRLENGSPEQERRLALAGWIASPSHPLTARVMVNRIWQGHFGVGLVETPGDFGRMGMKPTHPELLDWLAAEFIRGGWSIKRLHRIILLSGTYGQSSEDSGGARTDAEARFLWRYPSRRLEAEAIRDSMLAVSGQLDRRMYGRGFNLFDKRGGLSGFEPVESFTGEGLRRMIYAHKVRREPEAVFGAFDCPDAGQSTAIRRSSTTPIQALNLFNSRFTLDAAAALSRRVESEVGSDPVRRIARAYILALGRAPAAVEISEAEPVVREHGLTVLCRALFNSNEFLFLP
ncbi:MAG: DUF1553 domain-containing protein [Verrucomicrobia bacterium]|nr:DUF1553 domain-containing protein [Verrucomicrobiota bacterium]